MSNWAKTVGFYEVDGKPFPQKNANAYMAESVVIMCKLTVAVSANIGCLLIDKQYNLGYFKMLWDPQLMLPWLPLGFGYALADVAENLAGGRVDAALMSVLSQSRLVGTAL